MRDVRIHEQPETGARPWVGALVALVGGVAILALVARAEPLLVPVALLLWLAARPLVVRVLRASWPAATPSGMLPDGRVVVISGERALDVDVDRSPWAGLICAYVAALLSLGWALLDLARWFAVLALWERRTGGQLLDAAAMTPLLARAAPEERRRGLTLDELHERAVS